MMSSMERDSFCKREGTLITHWLFVASTYLVSVSRDEV